MNKLIDTIEFHALRETAAVLRTAGWWCDSKGHKRTEKVIWKAYDRVFTKLLPMF
jgi:hypothetical protein